MPSTAFATPQAWFSSAPAARGPRREWRTSWVASSVPLNVAVNLSMQRTTAGEWVIRSPVPVFPYFC